VPGSKVAIWGMVIPSLIGNPYGTKNPTKGVVTLPDIEIGGSLDPGTYTLPETNSKSP